MRDSGNEMRHEGIVKSVDADSVTVDIPVSSACAECHARSVCGSDAGQERTIHILRKDDGTYRPGDKVVISITKEIGMKAVLLAYVFPFVILLVLLLTLPLVLESELIAGIVCIGVLVLYYLILAAFRKKIDSGFRFNIVSKI